MRLIVTRNRFFAICLKWECRTNDEVEGFRARIRALGSPIIVEAITTGDELLLTIDCLLTSLGSTPELHRIASQASNMHYTLQAQRGLLVNSLRELLEADEPLLNSYERYRAYHTMLVAAGTSGDSVDRWRRAAIAFYDEAKSSGDCASMTRMGITLVGSDIDGERRAEARHRLEEISTKEVMDKSNMNRQFLTRRLAFLEKEIGHAA